MINDTLPCAHCLVWITISDGSHHMQGTLLGRGTKYSTHAGQKQTILSNGPFLLALISIIRGLEILTFSYESHLIYT